MFNPVLDDSIDRGSRIHVTFGTTPRILYPILEAKTLRTPPGPPQRLSGSFFAGSSVNPRNTDRAVHRATNRGHCFRRKTAQEMTLARARSGREGSVRYPANAPPHDDPYPAVQPKQWLPVTILLLECVARLKSVIWEGAPQLIGS
jgi:hypothetical protein